MQALTLEEVERLFPDHVSIPTAFRELLTQEALLFAEKNHDYASGGKLTGNFDRVAGILQQYPNFPFASPQGVAIIYMLKQLDCIMWGLCQGIEHKVEGLHTRAQDVSVYAKILQLISAEHEN